MRASSAFILVALAATAAAQDAGSEYTFPPGFDLSKVDADTKASWCTAQRNTCPLICNGAASPNTCNSETLQFDCTCINGTVPDVSPYQNTIPFFVCQENFVQCIENHPDDADGQKQCKEEKEKNCGTIKLSPTSADEAATSTATDDEDDDEPTETPSRSGAQSTASTTSNADAEGSDDAAPLTQSTNMGLLTSLVVAALGLLM